MKSIRSIQNLILNDINLINFYFEQVVRAKERIDEELGIKTTDYQPKDENKDKENTKSQVLINQDFI